MITREEALELLMKYNKEDFHIHHGKMVEGTMRYFAEKLGYGEDVEFWARVGLLHDIDFEMWKNTARRLQNFYVKQESAKI